MKYAVLSLMMLALALSGCRDQEKLDDDLLIDYIEENNLDALKTSEGLYYVIDSVGTGDNPTINDRVTVHYRGYTLEEEIFDSSYDRGRPSTFSLGGVIEGWQIGIPLFKEGGGGKLLIPSELAYGNNPPPGNIIGKNEVLIFDIELIEIEQ